MGKSSAEHHAITEEEFVKLEHVLNQTASDASACLKLLKKHLSEYDSRNGNHFSNTATSYLRNDMRSAKDTAAGLKHVAREMRHSGHRSKAELSSARNMMDATAKAMENLKMTGRNYDKANKQSKGIKGTIDVAMGGHHNHDTDDNKHGLLGKHGDQKHHDEHGGGLFGKKETEEHHHEGGILNSDNHTHHGEDGGGLFGKKETEGHHGLLHTQDKNGGGIIGSSETVETIVEKTIRDNFSLTALDHQLTAAEKSMSPSMMERAKEKMHDVKDKLMGDKTSHESHHSKPHMVNP
ncbi:unnamed protein product [Peronospora belbahrii]|uniref:Uncharacterized protein n=1 Tax=Peronospora belbahrii TaxID=622444 RepID=A0AAU9L4S2_9STRA|nr:unnamed protein product [Peronospora belbahrii]